MKRRCNFPFSERSTESVHIRYLDRVVVKDDGYKVAFKAGVTVEVEV